MQTEKRTAKSRLARVPISVPSGIKVELKDRVIRFKGAKGEVVYGLPPVVDVEHDDGGIRIVPKDGSKPTNAIAGTLWALIKNMLHGVSVGFERKLECVGVGYRAQMKGKSLGLSLGLSHPVDYTPPAGISIVCPSQTEIVVSGIDKQMVGQVAAIIRAYRPPEPYKGKGIRYAGEQIVMKETKKK